MKILYFLSVYLHILSAMIWIGGMIFLGVVLIPVVRKPVLNDRAAELIRWTGERFRYVGWATIFTLLATGVFNVAYRFGWGGLISAELWGGRFGRILSVKLIFVGIILLLSAIHDFYVGPRATEILEHEPESPEAEKIRHQASLFGRVNLLLSLIVVFLAIMLVRGAPW